MKSNQKVVVIGAGLAGIEAAWLLASNGVEVVLIESKRHQKTPAQKSELPAELVCTNSLKSKDPLTAHGLLKLEMKDLGSLVLEAGNHASVPAGDALAVDREKFSTFIFKKLTEHPLIQWVDKVVENPLEEKEAYQANAVILATGPLPHSALESWLTERVGDKDCYFYDAIAPVIDGDTIDTDHPDVYFKDRHKDSTDYLNLGLDKVAYEAFVAELQAAERIPAQNFEKPKFFESCLPIDLMADRGVDTLRFSCMKPIGLRNVDKSYYAVIQLRREKRLGEAYNMVGFQNRLRFGDQSRIFRTLPGLKDASFFSLGSVHRNTYLNAQKVLTDQMEIVSVPGVFCAGQMTGVEGYTESAASGLYVATQVRNSLVGHQNNSAENGPWPVHTAIGALINRIRTWEKPVPTNINFGLFATDDLGRAPRGKRADRRVWKRTRIVERARACFPAISKASSFAQKFGQEFGQEISL